MEDPIILLLVAGFAGALVKDIIDDNKIEIPKCIDGKLALGSLGGCIVGAVAGYLVDTSIPMAFAAGYAGTGIIEGLLAQKKTNGPNASETNESLIRRIAKEEGVDPDLAVNVAKCESALNEKAVNTNKEGSKDRGLFQINDKYHPEITDVEAFNAEAATRFFCKAVKAGNISWWDASKKCWAGK
jgi:hypothetical protein